MAGTPVKSCIRTRAGTKAISRVPADPGAQRASDSMSSAMMVAPSSWRSRFSSSTLRLNGSRSAPSTAESRWISNDVSPTDRVPRAPGLAVDQDVALGVLGELLRLLFLGFDLRALLLEVLLGVDEGLHVVLRLEARDLGGLLLDVGIAHGAPAVEGGVRIDQVLERQALVDEVLDLVDALTRDVAAHARAVVRHLVDPAAIRIVVLRALPRDRSCGRRCRDRSSGSRSCS